MTQMVDQLVALRRGGMVTTPDLAGHIHVSAIGDKFSLTIDGQEFPWYITSDGVQINVTDDASPAVTITIMAKKVTAEHDLS